MRYDELRTTVRATMANDTWSTNVGMLKRLEACYTRNGHQFDQARPIEEQLWGKLAERSWFVKEGYRGNLCRFLSLVAQPLKHVP